MDNSVYIIVLNWNGTADTIECLKSIKSNSYCNYTIVLVDNGSEKKNLLKLENWCANNFQFIASYTKEDAENGGLFDDEKKLKGLNPDDKLVFIKNHDNLGFAAGNNVALRYAMKLNVQYTLLLNNDTVINKNAIYVLMSFIVNNKKYVAVTPQIRYFDQKDTVWNCGGKILWFGNRKYYYAGKRIDNVPQKGYNKVTFITGCALLFKPNATGILSEKFFFGEEDLDFCFRQKYAKNKMACVYESVIYHKVSTSIKKVTNNVIGKVYLNYLSRLINNRQYSSMFIFVVKVFVILGYAIPMIKLRYKFSFKQIYNMVISIFKELKRIDRIDKEYYFNSIKLDFSKQIKWKS